MSVPAPIELCVKWYGRHQCFLSRSRFTPCLSMEGGLSVIMVMEDCQCSYTGLFDQVPGVIRNGRVISKPKSPPYFHLSQSCMAQGCNFFFFISHPDRHEVERLLSDPSLRFNLVHWFYFFGTNNKKRKQKKKQNKQKQNPH